MIVITKQTHQKVFGGKGEKKVMSIGSDPQEEGKL